MRLAKHLLLFSDPALRYCHELYELSKSHAKNLILNYTHRIFKPKKATSPPPCVPFRASSPLWTLAAFELQSRQQRLAIRSLAELGGAVSGV